jgi:soluble lytic murein transglycosylase-like protein
LVIANEVAAVERRVSEIAAGPHLRLGDFEALADRTARRGGERVAVAAASPSRAELERYVGESAAAAGIDPALVDAVIANESGFDPRATSSSGARGLMQLMPGTAASLGVADAYDPAQNVSGGTRYLRSLLDRFGSLELAVAAYNAGPAAVAEYGGIPPYPETKRYVRSVLSQYRAATAANPSVSKTASPR